MEVNPYLVAAVVGLAIAIVAGPYLWGLLASRRTSVSAKGTYQQKAVVSLLTIKDSLEVAGHPEASRLCRDSIIALICEGEESATKTAQGPAKSLFQ